MRSWLALLGTATGVANVACESATSQTQANARPPSSNAVRRLEDYAYVNDVSSYNIQFGKCQRVRLREDNDDDDAEGNSYFYNGRYHAQYVQYASFFMCTDGPFDGGQGCGSCNYNTEYVTDLETYIYWNVAFVQKYCGNCAGQCRRRHLEDAGDDNAGDDIVVDEDYCSACASQCSLLNENPADGADETAYQGCQEAYEDDETGLQIYSAPTCGDNGNIVIGMFYDDECTVKHSGGLDYGFAYNTFQTVQDVCIECGNSNGLCDELYGNARHCADGVNKNGGDDDDMPVCKAFKETARTYYQPEKTYYFLIPIALLVVCCFGGFFCGSYTYYIRHREKPSLATQDHDMTDTQDNDAPTTELPPMT